MSIIDNFRVEPIIRQKFGRKIQTDFDDFLIKLKKEDKMFKIGAVVAHRLHDDRFIIHVNVPPMSSNSQYLYQIRACLLNIIDGAALLDVESLTVTLP